MKDFKITEDFPKSGIEFDERFSDLTVSKRRCAQTWQRHRQTMSTRFR